MKKRAMSILLILCLVLVMNPMTASAAHNHRAKLIENWYYLRCMNNYLNIDAKGNAELRDKSKTAEGNTKFLVHLLDNGGWGLKTEDGRYLGVELSTSVTSNTDNNKKMNGIRVKALSGIVPSDLDSNKYSFRWDFYSENSKDIWSLRPQHNVDVLMNASGKEKKDGTSIVLWTHIDRWRCSSTPNPDAPQHGEFRLIPAEDPSAGTGKAVADGWYFINPETRGVLNIDGKGNGEVNNNNRSTFGTNMFYVEDKGKNQITMRLPDGRYLGIADSITDGVRVKAVKNPYLWNCYSEDTTGLKSQGKLSFRPSADTSMILNVSGGKKEVGTPIILWTHKSMDAPGNATFELREYEEDLPSVAFEFPPKINKITESLYVNETTSLSVVAKGTVKWSSSDKSIATVSSDGEVTAKKKGTVTITASVGDKKASCKVTIMDNVISNANLTLEKGNSDRLSILGIYNGVKWKTSDKSVVTISSDGVITAVAVGKATITATVKGKSYTCKVKVIAG